MSKETFYFRHDYNARTDRKLVNITMKHGMQGVGVYWCLVEMLYEECGYLPLEYERITFELRTDTEVIRSVINDFDVFENDGDKFWSNAVLERLRWRCEKSEKARESINKRWDKIRNTNVIRPNVVRNTIQRKGKERKGKDNKEEKESVFLLPEWIKKETWAAFMDVRKKLKAPQTDHALSLIISKLNKLRISGQTTEEILNESITNGWKGVFPLKGGDNGKDTYANQGTGQRFTPRYGGQRQPAEIPEDALRDITEAHRLLAAKTTDKGAKITG
jgi:hypothetical protein